MRSWRTNDPSDL